MSRIMLRIALVIILCIQVTLWSQTRQAQLQASSVSYPVTLWSRSVLYANQTGNPDTCSPRSFPLGQQCSHVQESCPPSKTLLRISYVQKYFCSSPRLRAGYFLGLVVWLLFLFSTLGISASDFFCPNLATISEILGLDENVAGVTFLALGNGSPDVFSTFSAMKANSGSLAIGELLGAASFIVSVVVGSMAIIKPFKVNKGPFLRDIGFFTVAIALLLAILIDGNITAWEAGLLVLLYVIYVAVVVVQSWYERRQQRKREKENLIRAQYDAEDTNDVVAGGIFYRDDPNEEEGLQDNASDETLSLGPTSSVSNGRLRAHSNASTSGQSGRPHLALRTSHQSLSRNSSTARRMSQSSHIQNLPSYSLLGALEFRTAVNNLRQQSSVASIHHWFETSPITPYAGGHYHNPLVSSTSKVADDENDEGTDREGNPWERSLEVPLDERHPGHRRHDSDPHSHHSGLRGKSPTPSITVQTEEGLLRSPEEPSPPPTSVIPPRAAIHNHTHISRIKTTTGKIFHVLFPTLQNFREKSAISMVAALFAAPAVLALTITLPVVVTPRQPDDYIEKNQAVVEGAPTLGNLIDFEEEGVERPLVAETEEILEEELHFNKWLMAAQCIFGPLFTAAVIFGLDDRFKLLCALVAGTIIAALVISFADEGNDPAARIGRTCMGFFVAIVWIMAIADEVVQVLQTFGLIFGLSDAIIGLTIFAVGNSLPDFVANITVAAFAPIMGFSACFGGPMLNILLGVGLSGFYVIRQTGGHYELEFSTTLLVSSIGLLILLTATVLFVPWNGYMLTRSWGIFLIISYTILMTINVITEVRRDMGSS